MCQKVFKLIIGNDYSYVLIFIISDGLSNHIEISCLGTGHYDWTCNFVMNSGVRDEVWGQDESSRCVDVLDSLDMVKMCGCVVQFWYGLIGVWMCFKM